MTEQEPQDNKNKSKSNAALVSSISGTIGASIGKCFVHPIDTIKAKIQVQKYSVENVKGSLIMQIAKDTVSKEGAGGLYRGFAISLYGSMPAAGLYFGSYEFFKRNTLQYEYL